MKQDIDSLIRSYDSSSKNYDDETNTFHHIIQEYVTTQNLLFEIGSKTEYKILDSGGGTGKYSIMLKKLGFDIELCDISPESINIARSKIINEGLLLETYICNSENTTFSDHSFDMIIMNGGVISYSPEPEKLLREANRLLKPNGVLWFDFFNSLGWAIECPDIKYKTDLPFADNKLIQMPDWDYPARIFSQREIEKLLGRTGFSIKSKYGLVILSNSLPLDTRYSKLSDKETIDKYCKIELQLSREKDCIGSAWSISICAIKLNLSLNNC